MNNAFWDSADFDFLMSRVDRFMYVRDIRNEKIGIVVRNKRGQYGWSLYNDKKEDEPAYRERGLRIALSRSEHKNYSILDDLDNRIKRWTEFYRRRFGTYPEGVFCKLAVVKSTVIKMMKWERDTEKVNEM